jgi:hypothetical protein
MNLIALIKALDFLARCGLVRIMRDLGADAGHHTADGLDTPLASGPFGLKSFGDEHTRRLPQPQPRFSARELGRLAWIDASSRYRPWHAYWLKTTMWVTERLAGGLPFIGKH